MVNTIDGGSVTRPRIAIADVTASLNPASIRENSWVVRLCRPLANAVTPLFYNHGWSANACTGLRAVAAFTAAAALACAGDYAWSMWIASAFFYVGYLLDCVDGNIARLSQDVTYWGKFIDGLGDLTYFALAPAAAGIGAWRTTGSTSLLVLGAMASMLLLANHLTRYRLSFFREWMTGQSGPLSPDVKDHSIRIGTMERRLGGLWVNVTFILPLLLIVPGSITAYAWAVVVFEIAISSAWIVITMIHSNVLLDRKRRSRHSADNHG